MLKKLFSRSEIRAAVIPDIIIVSGLPRSGTSMLMKMLAEGGVPVLSDALRGADADNPNGYYEFEPVKQLSGGQTAWLEQAPGKALKVISGLLEYLPAQFHYKIIFMERDIQEILASQQKMLARRGEVSALSDAEMQAQFEQHLSAVKFWLARQPNLEVLYLDYKGLVTQPAGSLVRIVDFLGLPLDVHKMEAVPSAQLYRNRA